MATLSYTDIQPGVFFRMNGEVYETILSVFSKKSRQKGANQVRVKNLMTGAVTAKTFHTSDSFEEVVTKKGNFVFVYMRGNETVIHPKGVPSDRIAVSVGASHGLHLLPGGTPVIALIADGSVLTLTPPPKVDVLVREAPPSVRGNTSQGGSKRVVIETGATVVTPLFIETGDRIRVNTDTGAYTERVAKAAAV